MRKLLAVTLAFCLAGCGTASMDLGPEWAPLETVRERPKLLRNVGSPTATTTVAPHVYVRDLDEWKTRYVPGTPKFMALLRHEQEHARRQLNYGKWSWIARYGVDKDFALLEEQIGYYYELTELRRLGQYPNVDGFALGFSGYENLAGRLISFNEAKAWILDVLAGRWTPPN